MASMTESQIQFKEIPTLSSERILLRPFKLSDAKEVQRMAGNVKVAEMTEAVPHPYLDGMAEEWISDHLEDAKKKNWSLTWAIVDRASDNLVGCISFESHATHRKAVMGYWVGEEHWNRGVCTEAAEIGIRYIFETTDMNRIKATHIVINPGSGKVMQKLGMQKEGILRQEMYRKGEFQDLAVYGLLRSEFQVAKILRPKPTP